MKPTGMVVRVDADDARRMLSSRRGRRFDLVAVDVLRRRADRGGDDLAAWVRHVRRALRSAVDPAVETAVAETIAGLDPVRARTLLRVVGLHLAGDPFVLAVVDPGGERIPTVEIRAAGDALGARIRLVDRVEEVARVRLARPVPADPVASVPADLLTIVCGPDERVAAAADRWLTHDSVSTLPGFSIVGSIVADRLRDLGLGSAVSPLLGGLRRRTWYRNALVLADAERAIAGLRAAGIGPTLLGDLGASVVAAGAGRVRSAGDLTLLVAPADLDRAAAVVAGSFGIDEDRPGRRATGSPDRRRIRLGARRSVEVTSRWLHGTADARVPWDPALAGPTDLGGTTVAALRPTARLFELWARRVDRRRHDWLASTLAVAELVRTSRDDIDRRWVTRACARAELPPPSGGTVRRRSWRP